MVRASLLALASLTWLTALRGEECPFRLGGAGLGWTAGLMYSQVDGGSSSSGSQERDASGLGSTSAPGSTSGTVFKGEITASAWLASAAGSVQTPKGGGQGTTSPDRPRLDEIGLDGLRWLPLVDGGLTLFEDHELHVNYAALDIGGRDALKEDLLSQGQTFPAGAKVKSKLQLDLLRFGYRAPWLSLKISEWSLTPEIGLSFDPFTYKLSSSSATGPVNRSYTIAFPYLGISLAGPVAGPLRTELDVSGSAGINGATFAEADLRLVYTFLQHGRLGAALVVGLRGTWLRRSDSQSPVPNDVNLRLGSFSDDPWGGVNLGLRITF